MPSQGSSYWNVGEGGSWQQSTTMVEVFEKLQTKRSDTERGKNEDSA